MRNIVRLITLASTVFAAAAAQSPGITAVAGTAKERSLSSLGISSQTQLATRELLVDLTFAGGTAAKGRITVVYEPSTGFFFHRLEWSRKDYPKGDSWVDQIASHSRIAATTDRLMIIIHIAGFVSVWESTERAVSLNEAEAKSFRWHNDRLPEVEARSYKQDYPGEILTMSRASFPTGFFRSEFDSAPGLPLKLVDMVRANFPGHEEHFLVTWESTETHQTLVEALYRERGKWRMGRAKSD